jgi:Tol biopolymer transport system component
LATSTPSTRSTHNRKLGVDGYAPSWSPDGTKIVFNGNGSGIHVVHPDGTGLAQLTNGSDVDPRWSPDGTTIAFSRYDLVTSSASQKPAVSASRG